MSASWVLAHGCGSINAATSCLPFKLLWMPVRLAPPSAWSKFSRTPALSATIWLMYYFRQWCSLTATADHVLSNAFVRSRSVIHVQRRRALQYRTGTLYTSARVHLLGRQISSACRLCGRPDNPHHSVSGCSHLSLLATSRHNAAGHLLLHAVRSGAHGAYLISADMSVSIPSTAPLARGVPDHIFASHTTPTSRPDLVLRIPGKQGRMPTIVCVKLVYCCDLLSASRARARWHRTRR